MKFIIVFLLLITSAKAQNFSQVDPAFLPTVKLFLKEGRSQGVNLSSRMDNIAIKFGYPERLTKKGDSFAYSFTEKKQIIVSKKFWNNKKIDPLFKQLAIMHELGHTVLKREHSEYFMMVNGLKVPSIMDEHFSHYLKNYKNKNSMFIAYEELFNKKRFDQIDFIDSYTIPERVVQIQGMNRYLIKK
jgi:hypothetical protein